MVIHNKLAAVISNEEEIQKMSAKMALAKAHNIQVTSEDFLSSIESRDPYLCIFSHCISEWGGNVSFELPSNFCEFVVRSCIEHTNFSSL